MTYKKQTLARKIAIINYKGGTGKTTTLINIAHGLALEGKRVLIVDTDPQGSAGYHLGIQAKFTLYDLLIKKENISKCIIRARENLDIIVANEHLFPAEIALSQIADREWQLSKCLEPIVASYDYILLDCAPSINILNQNALLFCDEAFLPVPMDFLALVGIKQLLKNIKVINKVFNTNIKITKIIPTLIDEKKSTHIPISKSLDRVFKPILSATEIHICPSIAKSCGKRQSVFEYAPKSTGASDYQKLVQEVLNDI